MTACTVCGNESAEAFTITLSDGTAYTFDSLECAMDKVAPRCGHCGCRVLGHGVRSGSATYCCQHCARAMGVAVVGRPA